MMDKHDIDSLAARLAALVPEGLARAQQDVQANMRDVLAQGLRRLDLVTREEFDVQAQVLAQTRAKLEALERTVGELEAVIAAHDA
ncbi:MAG: accessory factor UbiK family protein [Xanthomonadales bacterium]|jgi:BMFP domain-containing protein YqiC|nr:accessory factor UbiK family protein [Xanthomonadales bacterium]HXE78158.1 accessory factor UbiK family protein [Rhodanobacter sp.]